MSQNLVESSSFPHITCSSYSDPAECYEDFSSTLYHSNHLHNHHHLCAQFFATLLNRKSWWNRPRIFLQNELWEFVGMTLGKQRVLAKSSCCIPSPHVSQAMYPPFWLKKIQDVFFKSSQLLFSPCAWVSEKYLCLFSCLSYSALSPVLFRKNPTVSVKSIN